MIRLYDANCKDFDNNGIGILKDTIKCEVSEALNGELVLDMEYPVSSKYIEYIINENIIKCDAGLEDEQLFRIKNVKPDFDIIKIYAEHISYDLADNFLEDVYPQNINGEGCLEWILTHTLYPHNFIGFSDIQNAASARYVRKNPIEAIIGDLDNSFVKLWGGELKRNNFIISMLTKRGNNKGYKIKHRKNLTGLDFTIDNSNIITKIMPQGHNGLFLPEKYVDSPYISNYPHPKIQLIEFSDVKVKEKEEDEEGFATKEEAYEELRRLCNLKYSEDNIDKPIVNLKVDFVDLSKTTEYQNYAFLESVSMGDTVTVELDYIQVEVRVIKTIYDSLLHRYTKLELGEFNANYITDSQKDLTNTIKKETNNLETSVLEQAKQNATEQLTIAMGGYIYKTQNELFIMDTNNPDTATKVWRWNLNGLGYSKNGINGPYELAMTQDGRIVADFITTGVLNANLITAGAIKSNNYKENVSGTSISLADGVIDTANFKVDANGKIIATGGKIGGFNLDQNNFDADLVFSKKYTSDDIDRIKNIIMGTIVPTAEDYEKYDLTKSGRINSVDWLLVSRLVNGLETGNAKFILNTNKSENAIMLQDDKGNIVTNIGRFGAYINNIKTGSFSATNIDFESLVRRAENSDDWLIYVGVGGYNNIDTSQISLYKSSGGSSIDLYGEFGRIEAEAFQQKNAGYAMHGKNTDHTYLCHWTGSQLQFWVDSTNVGTLSDKRLKTDIKQIDEDFIKIIKEIELKQFKIANRNGLISFGILAQDLMEIFNRYNKNPLEYEIIQQTQYKMDDDTIYYTINYEQFLLLRIMANEEEMKQRDTLIQKLEDRIKSLEEGKDEKNN